MGLEDNLAKRAEKSQERQDNIIKRLKALQDATLSGETTATQASGQPSEGELNTVLPANAEQEPKPV